MAAFILEMVLGEPAAHTVRIRESRWLVAGPVALAVIVLALGFYIPGALNDVLARAADALGGMRP